jgi:hypothetical protein
MDDRKNFLIGLVITLSTIVIGLISYIVYSEYQKANDVPERCPYQGWSYENGETFDSGDGCNVCVCYDGKVVCTEMACAD